MRHTQSMFFHAAPDGISEIVVNPFTVDEEREILVGA